MEEREEANETLSVLKGIIECVEKRLSEADVTPSLTDLTRLLELQRELKEDKQGALIVRWVDEWQETAESEE